jgi:hypothetical protein
MASFFSGSVKVIFLPSGTEDEANDVDVRKLYDNLVNLADNHLYVKGASNGVFMDHRSRNAGLGFPFIKAHGCI